ncbi:cytochrome b5-related protein-like isoform X3 [Musca autumnalis]|uniref:cytochrome b5-related protein-like isoform X3 n=1 Tax=Musca autumnalis TaxID=221902 RepID=UPI003CF8AD92
MSVTKETWKNSTISLKPPTYRSKPFVTNRTWLAGKREDDGAEGLWRIYDNLYDFSKFIKLHPGGSFWLEQTKGTDITEQFETHHIKGVPEAILKKYFVRKATQPRNYTLTLHENGFYRTLKRRVAAELDKLDKSPKNRTDVYHLLLLAGTVGFAILSALVPNLIFEVATALCMAWLCIAAHNYFHQRDNWQMYTFNLTMMNFNEWRISHALSHHVYTNSLHDLEMSLFEPFLCWVPNKYIASKARRVVSVIIQPMFYAFVFPVHFTQRVIRSIFSKNELFWHDIIGFSLPLLMLLVSQASSPLSIFIQWFRIIVLSSFLFGLIGLNTSSHHAPDISHDGDALRKDTDWGLYQLDTIIDRGDIKNSQFLVVTSFGEHTLHHMFPTLDHGILPQLRPIFYKTLIEFKSEMRESSYLHHIIGQIQQLLRTEPNPIAPDQRKLKKGN